MRVIFAKTLLFVFLAILPFQQAQSQPAPSTGGGAPVFIGDFLYRFAILNGTAVTFFCRSKTDNCLNLAAGWSAFSALMSYPLEGYARQRCNKLEGESMLCSIPGADTDFYLRQ